jgi:hypothetical protein
MAFYQDLLAKDFMNLRFKDSIARNQSLLFSGIGPSLPYYSLFLSERPEDPHENPLEPPMAVYYAIEL